MRTVFVAVGTNQGDLEANIASAIESIKEIPDTVLEAQSSFKEYAPEDTASGQPAYRNGVLKIRTDLDPLELLHKLQVIERRMGRASKGDGASRPIDLDILTYGADVVIQGKTLTVPHPRLAHRVFVLEPLAELAPDWKHPRSGKSASELLAEINGSQPTAQSDAPLESVSTAGSSHERSDEASQDSSGTPSGS